MPGPCKALSVQLAVDCRVFCITALKGEAAHPPGLRKRKPLQEVKYAHFSDSVNLVKTGACEVRGPRLSEADHDVSGGAGMRQSACALLTPLCNSQWFSTVHQNHLEDLLRQIVLLPHL